MGKSKRSIEALLPELATLSQPARAELARILDVLDQAIDGWCPLCECPGGAHEEACDVMRLEAALLGDGHG